MSAHYAERPPRPELSAHVRCLWSFEGEDAAEDQRVAPDGCCELIVHHGAPYLERGPDGDFARQPLALFAGQLTGPLHLRADAHAGVTAVRFEPAGAWAFTGRPLSDFTDRRAPLVEIDPEAGQLVEAVAAANAAERSRLVEAYVAARIVARPSFRDPEVERCVQALQAAEGRLPLDQLSSLPPRQLQRRFARTVGVPPRTFAAVQRFRRVFEALQEADLSNWTEAAQAAGYFDHPQMAREFQRFVGCSPSAFIAARPGLATSLADLAD